MFCAAFRRLTNSVCGSVQEFTMLVSVVSLSMVQSFDYLSISQVALKGISYNY